LVAGAVVALVVNRAGPHVIETITEDGPIRAVIGADAARYSDGWALILPPNSEAGREPPRTLSYPEARSWFFAQGAFDADASFLRLAVEGRSSATVAITKIQAAIASRAEPVAGTLIRSPSAGAQTVVSLVLDLDAAEPRAKTTDGADYFGGQFVTLGLGEIQIFSVEARSTTAVQWRILIEFRWRGTVKTVILDNGGAPFKTSGSGAINESLNWAWWESPPRLIRAAPEG
jgi:hypothetical protein